MKRLSKTALVEKLVENATLFPLLYPGKKTKVGEVILKLSDEQREICKTMTAKDFNGRIYF